VGHPLHVSDGNGVWMRSFGGDDRAATRSSAYIARRLARSTGSRFWAVPVSSYRLEQWDAVTGSLLRVFSRSEPTFPPHEQRSSGHNGTAPTPTVIDLHEDRSGLLWVLVRVAAPNWRAALGERDTTVIGRLSYRNLREDLAYHTLVEVIDVARREVIVSQRLSAYAGFFMDDGLIGVHREDETGLVFLEIVRLTLSR